MAGGNWCAKCITFDLFCDANREIDAPIKSDYRLYQLNYSEENENNSIFAKFGYPQRFGFPLLRMLNEDGVRVYTQKAEYPDQGMGYYKRRVYEFLLAWNREAVQPGSYKKCYMKNAESHKFLQLVQNPFKFSFFLLSKLPSAYFSGVRVKDISYERSTVTVPYKWFSQNPFRSLYFACQAMAAEMSTGLLAMLHVYGRKPSVSMLVIKVEGEFLKKGVSVVSFVCNDGEAMEQAIEETIASGESVQFTSLSIGTNEKGEVVSEFKISWSFKVKGK
jgi:hypothetical protein